MSSFQNKVVLATFRDLLVNNLVFSQTVETFIRKYPYTDETKTTRIIDAGQEINAAILVITALLFANDTIAKLVAEAVKEFGPNMSDDQLTTTVRRWFDSLQEPADTNTASAPPTPPAQEEEEKEGEEVSPLSSE